MRKIRVLLGLILATSLLAGPIFPAGNVNAQLDDLSRLCSQYSPSDPNYPAICQERREGRRFTGRSGLLTNVARLISLAAGVVAVALIMFAGFKFITASGDPNNIAAARNIILYALIGLAVSAVAQALVIYVLNRL